MDWSLCEYVKRIADGAAVKTTLKCMMAILHQHH